MTIFPTLNHWYSPRGFRRGLLACAVASALWMAWALAFAHEFLAPSKAGDPGHQPAQERLNVPGCSCGIVT